VIRRERRLVGRDRQIAASRIGNRTAGKAAAQ
jgi:hypothetical protein